MFTHYDIFFFQPMKIFTIALKELVCIFKHLSHPVVGFYLLLFILSVGHIFLFLGCKVILFYTDHYKLYILTVWILSSFPVEH